jgi:hypothetical protein
MPNFFNLDALGGNWDTARQSLADDLLQFSTAINQYLTTAHNDQGEQRAATVRGSVIGQLSGTLAEQPTGLGPANDGLLYFVTDYGSLVRWDGSAGLWRLAPGTVAPSKIDLFAAAPPASAGYVLCNGASTSYLVVDNPSLFYTNITLPDLVSTPAYLETGAVWTGAVVAASAGTISGSTGSGTSGSESSHTHTYSGTTTSPDSGSAKFTSDTTHDFIGNSSLHTHDFSGTTSAGSAHTHSVPALGAGTLAVDATGKPRHLVLLPYFKR